METNQKPVIKFSKVPYEQFRKDFLAVFPDNIGHEEAVEEIYRNIKLPTRSTCWAAGYDFYAPCSFCLNANKDQCYGIDWNATIPTGICIQLPPNYCLLLAPRSGLGFKNGMQLANTIGVIDPDYYYAENHGHIHAKFVPGFKSCIIGVGERFMQGIIVPFAITDDDNATVQRTGGFGSTGK